VKSEEFGVSRDGAERRRTGNLKPEEIPDLKFQISEPVKIAEISHLK
jgi:hypothetical protein